MLKLGLFSLDPLGIIEPTILESSAILDETAFDPPPVTSLRDHRYPSPPRGSLDQYRGFNSPNRVIV